MFKLLTIILLFSLPTFSQEQDYFQSCFQSSKQAQSAIEKLNFIKNKSDKINIEHNCLNFYLNKSRGPLYKKFLQTQFYGQFKITSNTLVKNKQCHLQLTKIMRQKSTNQSINLGKSTQFHQQKVKHHNQSKSQIIVTSGSNASLTIVDHQLNLYCEAKKSSFYLKISSISEEISLSLSRTLYPGQEVELANFIRNLNDKNRKLNLKKGIKTNSEQGREIISIKLKAK